MEYTYQDLLQVLYRLKSKSLISTKYDELIASINHNNPRDIVKKEDYIEYLKLLDEEFTLVYKVNNSTSDEEFFYFENTILNDMFIAIKNYNNLQQAYKIGDKYTIIPILNKKSFIIELGKYFINTNTNIDDYYKIGEHFLGINNKAIEELLNSPINEYYGDPKFIYDRTCAIEEAIINLYERSSEKERISNIAIKAPNIINGIKSICLNPNMSVQDYLQLTTLYQELLDIENNLRPFVKIEWEKYFQENNLYLIHVLSGSKVESNVMTKICTSLKSDDFNTIQYGHVGYEYGPNFDQIISICASDSGSWVTDKSEFISESGIKTSWQYGNKDNIFYEYGRQTVLYLPDKVLEEGKMEKYTEIVFMDPNHVINPLKAFYTDEATPDEVEVITELAEKQGIPLEYIDTTLTNAYRKGM